MQQRVINPGKAMRTLRKTSSILQTVLGEAGDRQQQASSQDKWSAREVGRHLLEYEPIIRERVQLILSEDMPILPSIDNQHITEAPDNDPDVQTMVRDLHAQRQELLAFLADVPDDQWSRQGRHPEQGSATLLDVVVNAAMHDIDHIDQIMQDANRTKGE